MIYGLWSPAIAAFCQQHGDCWSNPSPKSPPVLCSLSAKLLVLFFITLRPLSEHSVCSLKLQMTGIVLCIQSLQKHIPGHGFRQPVNALSLNRAGWLKLALRTELNPYYLIVLEIQREDRLLSSSKDHSSSVDSLLSICFILRWGHSRWQGSHSSLVHHIQTRHHLENKMTILRHFKKFWFQSTNNIHLSPDWQGSCWFSTERDSGIPRMAAD